MDRPIRNGDLVCVVRAPGCGCRDRLGHFFTVTNIRPQNDTSTLRCITCKKEWPATGQLVVEGHPSGKTIWIRRLIRIDPPALADETRQDEKLTA